ncbi:MAG: response regulator [Candidatus Omnitrophota bacterium]
MDQKKILVVDDEEILIRTFVILLERNGYAAYFVKNGDDAIEIAHQIYFNLIISDMRMPGKNGYETLKGIREAYSKQRKPWPPEIILTGYANDEELEKQVKELKPSVYLYKPFDMEELLGHVKRLLGEVR